MSTDRCTLYKIVFVIITVLNFQPVTPQGEPIQSQNKFSPLDPLLRTPNSYRTASGVPGHDYWQQQADYNIKVDLDDHNQGITGEVEITYHNNSPDQLYYLWLQLDQNVRMKNSFTSKIKPGKMRNRYPSGALDAAIRFDNPNFYPRAVDDFEGGFRLTEVKDARGGDLDYFINYTMMRIDLKAPLQPGEKYRFNIKYSYNINNRLVHHGRSGYEYFEEDDNYIYTIAQFFPRMAVYNEVEGWQNAQFTGKSEFALPFGNYDVKITVPADHLVAATGVLQNRKEVLTPEQLNKYDQSTSSTDDPVIIFSEEDALNAMKGKTNKTKTWHFKAENVRDFAFASSRRFIWDAMAVKFGDRTVMAMSMYPPEGNPLWEKYSTEVVAHTLKVYSRFTFDYPYPVAWSIHTKRIGMEYPMISFNGGRPEPDGTYSERTKWFMITVIIHEIGHYYFPMIVNSDERQWTWMDEGLNTFLQGLAEREWDHEHPYPAGRPSDIVDYMAGDQSNLSPIMTSGHLLKQFFPNSYQKPAAGLIILRETIMGRELFDYAFKQYAQRWKFKHPTPDDFFRIMEDASAVDLDWFWRGWFFGTDPVDIAIENVSIFQVYSGDPAEKKAEEKQKADLVPEELTVQRNRKIMKSMVERDSGMMDFYDSYDPYAPTEADQRLYERYKQNISESHREILEAGEYYCQVDFRNIGGMIMPLIVKFNYKDGSSEIRRIPAQIWERDHEAVSKIFILDKGISSVELDPYLETADIDLSNNHWPSRITPGRFEIYKSSKRKQTNPMQSDR